MISKGDNEMIPGAVCRFLEIYLMDEENSGKPQLEDCLMISVRPIITPSGVPYLQMRSVISLYMSGEERRKKETTGVGS